MKLISKFLNLMMWVVSFCIATIAEMGVWDLVALPSGTQGMITLDPNSESVSYFDTFKFWGADLKSSVTREPRYAVRGWFGSPEWWQKGTKWADKAVECVVGAVVPVVAPTYEINEMSKYCDYAGSGYSFVQAGGEYENSKFTETVYWNSKTDYSGDLSDFGGLMESIIQNLDNKTVDLWKVGSEKPLVKGISVSTANNPTSPVAGLDMGDQSSRQLYNALCKVAKYNSEEYVGWMRKFYTTDTDSSGKVSFVLGSDGKAEMKGSVVGLYFQFYMALIFAFFFVYENPIVVERQGDGSNSVSGGMRMRWTHHKKNKQEDLK